MQDYLIQEVQRVYRMQGVDINDKHIEVIVRQMMRKVRVDECQMTHQPVCLVLWWICANVARLPISKYRQEWKQTVKRIFVHADRLFRCCLGITKSFLGDRSLPLSAASFQETTRVLTEAAIKGKVGPVDRVLKENVIIGKLIPAGTGIACYRNVEVDTACTRGMSHALWQK